MASSSQSDPLPSDASSTGAPTATGNPTAVESPTTIGNPTTATPPSLPVDITIKNPTDRPGAPPFNIRLEASATVLQLKHRLCDTYPSSPPVAAQRLIYAGKLLLNSATLASVLANADPVAAHTFHLVVSVPPAPPSVAASLASSSASAPSSSSAGNTPSAAAGTNIASASAAAVANPALRNPIETFLHALQPYAFQPPPLPDVAAPFADVPAGAATGGVATPSDHAAYISHLQTVETLLAQSWQIQQNAAAASAAAANEPDPTMAAHYHAQSAHLSAQAAALNAQAHAHARVHATAGMPLPPTLAVPGPFAAATAAAAAAAAAAPRPQQPDAADNAAARQNGDMNAANVNHAANADANAAPNNAQQQQQQQQQNQGVRRAFPNGLGFDFRIQRVAAAAQGDAAAAAGAPRVRQFVFQFELNWSLLCRLGLLVYLLGQEGSPRKMYGLMIVAGLVYLYQMGHLAFARRVLSMAVPNPRTLMENLYPRQQASGEGETPPHVQRVPTRLGRVTVLLLFVYSFVYGFVCSLVPAWNPEPHPRMDELIPPRHGEPQAEQQPDAQHEVPPRDAREVGHEHAD